jgi:glycosyltransferase involved in cell wall biosynthesis
MNKLTLTFPYYNNPGMLKYQQEIWNKYPQEYKDAFEIIVVDDGSRESSALSAVNPNPWYNFRLYQIIVDVPWNQTSARNLSVYEADKNSWLFLTDIDHVLDPNNFIRLMKAINLPNIDKKYYYTFNRLNGPERGEYKYHPNSFLMHRSLYLKVGGYDEEFAGKVYATDGMFRKSLKGASSGTKHLGNISIIRFGREHIPDASTRDLKRGKEFQSQTVMDQIKQRDKIKRARGERPRVLSFPWKRLI